jgi:hypothetical protein
MRFPLKNYLKPILAGVLILTATGAHADTVNFNDTQNVSTGGTSFTFSQFDPSLGTLSAIDLIIQTSTIQGDVTYTRTGFATRTYSDANAAIGIDTASGFGGYSSIPLSFARSPAGSFTVDGSNPTQVVTVTGTTQSLIGGTPVTLGINPSFFGSYTGLGTVSFTGFTLYGDDNTGSGTVNLNDSNLFSPTSLTLRYTYSTGPVPIPEPGQVAASLLLLGGIGAYVFLKRRKKAATPAA